MSDQFKQAMRRFASSIAIVTSAVEEEWSGIAATAVMSVAADPPTIAVAINRSSSLIPVLDQARCFNVNLLAPRHAELVAVFGGQVKGRERFEAGDWQASTRGLPVLADAVALLECRVASQIEVATHMLFIGAVETIVNHPEIDPLLWIDGGCSSARALV